MPHLHPHADPPVADASVRLATPADASAIGSVQSHLWRELYAGVLPADVIAGFEARAFADVWVSSLASPPSGTHRALVACSGLEVVGFVAVGPSLDPDATDVDSEVLVLGVTSGSRRHGHGSRLVNAAADTARGAGFGRLRAWVPQAASSPSELAVFLASAGFETDGAVRDRVVGPGDADLQHEIRVTATLPE